MCIFVSRNLILISNRKETKIFYKQNVHLVSLPHNTKHEITQNFKQFYNNSGQDKIKQGIKRTKMNRKLRQLNSRPFFSNRDKYSSFIALMNSRHSANRNERMILMSNALSSSQKERKLDLNIFSWSIQSEKSKLFVQSPVIVLEHTMMCYFQQQ